MSDDDQTKDPVAEFNEKAKKYGTAYVVFSDALGGDSLKTPIKIIQIGLVAAAAFVVVAAIWARLGA